MTDWLLRATGVVLLLVALGLAWTRAPDRSVESLVARWAPAPSQFIDLDGQLVHLRDEGPRDDPLPVVLLHGTSASLHTWEGWAAVLRREHRVLTLDLPGFGLTGPATGRYLPGDYTAAGDARFVLDVLDRLGIRRCTVGGNSLGGEVAWRLALAAPQRVHKLVLVDSAGIASGPVSLPLGWHIARTPGLAWLAETVLPRSLVAQGVALTWGHPDRIPPALVDRYFELTLRAGNRRALGERLRRWQAQDNSALLATLRVPTLLLWGGRDTLIPPPTAGRFRAAIPGSRLVVFDDLGHVPQEEDPARSVAPVLDFIR